MNQRRCAKKLSDFPPFMCLWFSQIYYTFPKKPYSLDQTWKQYCFLRAVDNTLLHEENFIGCNLLVVKAKLLVVKAKVKECDFTHAHYRYLVHEKTPEK